MIEIDASGTAGTVEARGPGNVPQVRIDCENITTLFSAFGERGKPAETIASDLADELGSYVAAGVFSTPRPPPAQRDG